MAANLKQPQGLTVREYLATAVVFLDKARIELMNAPKRERNELEDLREQVDGFKESLADELWESIDDLGEACQDCCYCHRDSGYTAGKGLTDMPTRECTARTPMTCPAVAELLGGVE